MRTTLILLIAILTTCCNLSAQSISKRVRINGGQLEFDSSNNSSFVPMATRNWVQNYVATHGGGEGDTSLTAYTSSNGITLTSGNFTLGGALTGATTFTGVHNVNFGTSVSRMNQFNVYGTSGVLLQDNAVSGTSPTLQLSSGNFQLYGRAGTVLSTQNLSITSGGVLSLTGGGLVFNPTDSISINVNTLEVSYDTTNDKPLVINRNGRIKQGYFNDRTTSASDYSSYYVSLAGSYANPSWITSIPVSKVTFSGTSSQQLLGDGTLATRITNNNQLTNGAGYLTNITGKVTAGTNVIISGNGTAESPYVITSSGGSGASWGTISGTLSNQTDLQTALNAKEATITSGTTAQVWRGDKTWLTLNTANVPESGNLYYTDARARTSVTLTTTGTSGAATYNSTTGVLNIPNYATGSGVALTNFSAVAPLTYNNTTGVYSTSIATSRLVGRTTGGAGVMEEISVGDGLTFAAGSLSNAHTFSTGLTKSTNTITNNLSTGVSGGQSVVGGTASANNLTLSSTSHATKGKIIFGLSAYDEATSRLGIGTTTPSESLHLAGGMILGNTSATTNGTLRYTTNAVEARINGAWLSMTNPTASQLPSNVVYDNEALNLNGNTIENYSAKYNDQTGTSYTLLSSDNGKVVTFNNAGAITVTVPSGLPVGFNCMIVQKGAGQVTLSASSTTINNRQSLTKTAGQWAVASLISTSTNVFVSGGDMAN
jgi:hypothetical protein